MGVSTLLTCDICKNSWNADENKSLKLTRVEIKYTKDEHKPVSGYRMGRYEHHSHYCSSCLSKSPLAMMSQEEIKVKIMPTFEEKVAELLSEIGVRFGED